MNYIQDVVRQEKKDGQRVCGDTFLIERTREHTVFVLCDGIGSGIYANIAAKTCASRLMGLAESGSMSNQTAAATVAASMHRARQEDFPFAAFCLVKIFTDGHYTVHTYESPSPIVIGNGKAFLPELAKIQAGKEWIYEASGILRQGDQLMVFSDGISQAGLGRGFPMGIGEEYICDILNQMPTGEMGTDVEEVAERVMELAFEKSGDAWEDDSTLAILKNREGQNLVVMTGPPSNPSKDREYVLDGMGKEGWKVVCGSSTSDIVARELDRELVRKERKQYYGEVPEYHIDGLDVVSEGALVLNRVYNVLEECEVDYPLSVVEKICAFMRKADSIEFLVGNAYNVAHTSVSFKEIGVMPRHTIVRALEKKLKEMGKLVTTKYY